jgi:hypothetical protein
VEIPDLTQRFFAYCRTRGIDLRSFEDFKDANMDWRRVKLLLAYEFKVSDREHESTAMRQLSDSVLDAESKFSPREEALQRKEFSLVNKHLRNAGVAWKKDPWVPSQKLSPIDLLCNTSDAYPTLYPALMRLLGALSSALVKERIVRALTVKDLGEEGLLVLFDEFNKLIDMKTFEDGKLKWAISNALTVACKKTDLPKLKALIAGHPPDFAVRFLQHWIDRKETVPQRQLHKSRVAKRSSADSRQ